MKSGESYIITDGERFLYQDFNGRFVPTKSEAMADIYTKEKAQAIYRNSLSVALKKVFYIEKICTLQPSAEKKVKFKADMPMDYQEEKLSALLGKINTVNQIRSELVKRESEINAELEKIGREMEDILHYCEFTDMTTEVSNEVAEMIKERRVLRRKLKDEKDLILAALDCTLKHDIRERVTDIQKRKKDRVYVPRELTGLFNKTA